jgi:hypothetical protein
MVLLATLATTACMTSQSRPRVEASQTTTSEELLNARTAYDNCLLSAARSADDGKSDAATIAVAIKSRCIPQTERVTRALASATPGPGITPGQAYLSAKKIVEEAYPEDAIKAVLDERSARR